MILTLKFDILLKNVNHGFYLVMVDARRALLSSDNSNVILASLYRKQGLYLLTGIIHRLHDLNVDVSDATDVVYPLLRYLLAHITL